MIVLLLSLLTASGADSARAVPPADSVVVLPEVRVERERALSDARRRMPTAFVTELRAGTSGRAMESVADLVGEAAGAHVVQYGGLGAFSTVSLRGSPAGQVGVYLDGVPLTSATHGVVNLADLPATAVDVVEVYRGVAPLALGRAMAGGAINVVTLDRPRTCALRVARGAYDTWETRATAGATRGAVRAWAHGGVQSSSGAFEVFDDHGTPYNLDDDSVHPRTNNHFDAASAIAGAAWSAPGGVRVQAREEWFRKAQGVQGVGTIVTEHARLRYRRALSDLTVSRPSTGAWPGVRLATSLTLERTRLFDPGAELKLGAHDSDDRADGRELSLGFDERPFGSRLTLEGGGALRLERATQHDPAFGLPDPPESHRTTRGAWLGARVSMLGGRALLQAARRWDRLRDEVHAVGIGVAPIPATTRELDTPQLGARVALPLGLEARANWTDAQRPPDFLELFGRQGSVLGNPALRPERARTWDTGGAWRRVLARGLDAAIEWAHFESRANDLVVYERLGNAVRPVNVAAARVHGEEGTLTVHAPWGWSFSGAATFQTAIDTSPTFRNGSRIPLVPARESHGRVAWRHRALRLTADVQSIGNDYLRPSNRDLVASRTLIGASAGLVALGDLATLTLEGRNLSDNHISDVAGYPLPGRSLFVSIDLHRESATPTPHPGD